MSKKKPHPMLSTPTPPAADAEFAENVSANSLANLVVNGLADAIFGFGPGTPGAQLSQVDTIFYNMRWYLISNMRQPLSEAYAEIALIQTIVDVPVDDGLRGGVEISTKQLSEDEIAKLEAVMEREGDLQTVGQANKWNRLFGGAGVLIMTDQPPETPFNINAVTKDSKLAFRAVDMWELYFDKQNVEGDGTPIDNDKFETYNYYSKKLHKTRVMPMRGIVAPSFIRPRLRGWGMTVVEALVRSINQYLKATDLGFEVLDEFKLDIFKIKGLTQALMSPAGTQKIRERVALANQQKNFQNALTMDSEDDYIQKQLSWSGLGDAMDGIRKQISSDMRIPMIKLFGQAAGGGLGNTGEDEIEVYNSMVESQVRSKCKYEILRIIEIRCQQMFGHVPTDLAIAFKPLRVMSAEQEEKVKDSKFNRTLQARQAGEITSLEFREICNRGNLFDIQLDTTKAALNKVDEERPQPPALPGSEDDAGNDDEEDEASDVDEKTENSLGYDLASYETDGGDNQFNPHHERDLENPDRIPDRDLVARAKAESIKAFGKEKWQFVFWYYKQHGGKIQ